MTIADELRTLTQRVGANAGKLRTEAERSAFVSNIRADIANIIYQHNMVTKPLFENLPDVALEVGIAGQAVYTDSEATAASASVYYNTDTETPLTIKETTDVIISELARLENMISAIDSASVYDDTAVLSAIDAVEQNIQQLTIDTMGVDYTLDGDGVADLSYSLSQIIDALGALFTGYTPTGNTYDTTYPAISFSGDTLQGAYDSGTTDAGLIILENAKGPIVVQDDNASPIGTYIEWQDDSGTSLGEVGAEGLVLKTDDTKIRMTAKLLNMTEVAGTGALAVQVSGAGDAELVYRNDDAGDPIAQITRNGIVKELEIGCTWITPAEMINAAAVRAPIALGAAPNTDIEYAAVQLPNAAALALYLTVAPPLDENLVYPTNALLEVFACPSTNPGAGPFVYTLSLYTNDSSVGVGPTSETLITGTNLTPAAWALDSSFNSAAINMPANLNRLDRYEWEQTLDGAAGLIVFKLYRDPAAGSDTYTGDVSILGARVTWYR